MSTLKFSPEELAAFREEMCKGATDTQFALFIAECERRALVPGTHLFFQLRSVNEWNQDLNTKVRTKKATWITKIDAMRLIAQRTGQYQGQEPPQYIYLDKDKQPSIISDIPLPHPTIPNTPLEPWAARVSVFRTGFLKPFTATCRFDAYAVTQKNGNSVSLTDMWVRRGPEQLAKCSEVAALKGAFPEELGSLYITEEFEKEQAAEPEPAQPVVAAPVAPTVPVIDHTPAVPTNEPRPNEPVAEAKPEPPGVDFAKHVKKRKPSPEDTPVTPQNPEFQATDDDLPAVMWADDKPEPPPLTGKERAAKVQSYYALAPADRIRNYILKFTGAKKSTEITAEQWTKLFAVLDFAVAEGKEAFLKLLDASEATA